MPQDIEVNRILEAAIFAAQKHQGHVRKDKQGSPYITHPLQVAQTLWEIGGVLESKILVAAILHDTIEDTDTTPNEIHRAFGGEILNIVLEVTDDKSLDRLERKRLQIVHAPGLSHPARLIKLGDKLVNCSDILQNPPRYWPLVRRQEYIQWCTDVIAQIRGTNASLEEAFDEMLVQAQNHLEFIIQPFNTVNQRPWGPEFPSTRN